MNQDEKHLKGFLDHICVKLGFCLPKQIRDEIAIGGPYSPAEMARVVLAKEGLDPSVEPGLFRDVRNEFATFFKNNF